MTNIEQKALALVNEIERERGEDELTPRIMRDLIIDDALCRAIEQHEAFRQEVSDAVELSIDRSGHDGLRAGHINEYLGRFIIPAPKPDPLVDAAKMMGYFNTAANAWAEDVRAALDDLGFEIREKNDD